MVERDGLWEYEVKEDGTIRILSYCDDPYTLEVPETINGRTVTALGDYCFSPDEEYVDSDISDLRANFTTIVLPNTITEIGEGCFMRGNLYSINIPGGVKEIKERTFDDCYNLNKVTLNEGLEDIGCAAFYSCESLTTINIPSTVKKIEDGAFDSCENLEEFILPSSLEEIGDGVFNSCPGLVEIPPSVKKIGTEDGLFYNCENLKSVTIPDGVESFYGFECCYNLESVTIPESVTEISDDTFEDCEELTIYGKKGSYAETYANDKDIPFKEI